MIMENRVGSYTNFRAVTAEEVKIYEKVMNGLVGVERKVLAAAKQIVNGTNYAFLCDSKVVVPNAEPYNDLVIIHKPINGDPQIMEIRKVELI